VSGGPSGGCGSHAEHGESCEVGGCCEEVEVGIDLGAAAHSGASSAVAVAHEVAEFAFDFRAGGAVVVAPVRVLLSLTVPGERGFVDTDPDGASSGGLGAFVAQRTVGACVGEVGNPVAVNTATDRHRHRVGAGDGVGIEIDGETGFAETVFGFGRRLGPAFRVDAGIVETLLELAGAVCGVAIHTWLLSISISIGVLGVTGGPSDGVTEFGVEQIGNQVFGDGAV
jgi:hypothetical protein